jgi:hypothetical protein
MRAPRTWKQLERHPLSAEYPDLSGRAWEQFVADLREHGIVGERKIVLHQGKVLDGWQLQRACVEAGVLPEYQVLEGMTPDEYVRIANDNRRHETQEAALKRAQARRERIAAARQQGQSLRAIADEESVSEKTVRDDLQKSGAGGYAPEPAGGRTTGRDGKNYAATQPQRLCRPCRVSGKPKPDCPDCAALRKPAPKPGADTETFEAEGAAKARPRNGQAQFNWKRFNSALGVLARLVDTLANSYGLHLKDTPEKDGALRKLWEFREAVRVFYEKLSKQKAPT